MYKSSMALILLFSLISAFIMAQTKNENTKSRMDSVLFSVKGMTCQSCVYPVETKLGKINGIKKYNVSFEKGEAVVKYEREKVNPEKIEKEFEGTPYKVKVKKSKSGEHEE